MRSISDEYLAALSENSNQLVRASIRFQNGDSGDLTGDDVVSCSIDSQVSGEGTFDIGSAIIGKLSIELNNRDGRFDECDFTGSSIAVWVGKELPSGTEWIKLGVYYIDQPDSYGGTISLTALDVLSKFERPFSEFKSAVGLSDNYMTEIYSLVNELCRYCGVEWEDIGEHDALSLRVRVAHVNDSATCLDVLGYCCQLTCRNASATENGGLRTVWYNLDAFEGEDDADGGRFDGDSPYSTGDGFIGGTFLDYSSGDDMDGGTFFTNREAHRLYAFSSITVNTDDIVITGIRVKAQDETVDGSTEKGETAFRGDEGYVLSIDNNPLVSLGQADDFCEEISFYAIGMRFRPFSGKHIMVPSLEAGDPAVIIDRKQNAHRTYVTRVKFTVNGGMTISCGAKSASRNSAVNAGSQTSAYVKSRNDLKKELSARDAEIKNLGDRLADASGLYHTEVKASNGSIIFYLHDKATVDQSKIVYKISADAIGISTDGGKTYATGLSANGDAILNRIYAIGLDADYIKSGTIDAEQVNIRNIMSLGDDSTGVSIGKSEIDFAVNGTSGALNIRANPYSIKSYTWTNGGQPLVDPRSSDQTVSKRFSAVNNAVGRRDDGKTWYSVSITYMLGGDAVTKTESFSGLLDLETGSTPIFLPFGSTGGPAVYVTINQLQTNIFGLSVDSVVHVPNVNRWLFIYSLTLSCWEPSPSGSILSGNDEVFLTNRNLPSILNGGKTFSGEISIPYIYGNTMRNYNLYFEHGILVNYELLTPSDPGFK